MAVVDDPWRSSVHVGSAGALVKQGLLESRVENELRLTTAGAAALGAFSSSSLATAKLEQRSVLVEVTVEGLSNTGRDQLAARRMVDMFRVVANANAGTWDSLADFVIAGHGHPGLLTVAEEAILSVEPTDDEDYEVGIVMTALGPRPTSD